MRRKIIVLKNSPNAIDTWRELWSLLLKIDLSEIEFLRYPEDALERMRAEPNSVLVFDSLPGGVLDKGPQFVIDVRAVAPSAMLICYDMHPLISDRIDGKIRDSEANLGKLGEVIASIDETTTIDELKARFPFIK